MTGLAQPRAHLGLALDGVGGLIGFAATETFRGNNVGLQAQEALSEVFFGDEGWPLDFDGSDPAEWWALWEADEYQ